MARYWTNQNYLYRILVAVMIVFLLVVTPVVVIPLLQPRDTKAAWFDDTYLYRSRIYFTYTSSISSERRVNVVINTSALISGGKMQSDCDDMRFTDGNGKLLKYQLLASCNTSATSVDVVFPRIENGQNVGYMYYGNPQAGSLSQNVGSVTQITLPTGSNGGPTAIDDPGDPGALPGSGAQVVRTSSGTLYAFINDGGSCEMWKSADGSSWSEQDSSNNPSCTSGQDTSLAIDSNNVLHLLYINGGNADYVTFATSTDTFGSPETVLTYADTVQYVGIAVDSVNKPHAIVSGDNDGSLVDATLIYANRISGSWATVTIGSSGSAFPYNYPVIVINEDDIPEIAHIYNSGDLNSDLIAAVGDANNATSFTSYTVEGSMSYNSAGIGMMIDSSGNTWLAYRAGLITGSSDISIRKHNDTDGWTTWQAALSNTNNGVKPSLAYYNGTVYVFYIDDSSDVVYDSYNGTSWGGKTTLQTGTFQDPKVRSSTHHLASYGSYGIDYLYSNATDVYWASLGVASLPTIGSEEQSVSSVSSWNFDEGYGTTANDGVIGSNNALTITNASWRSSENCVSGSCLYFDGDADRASKSYSSDTELLPATSSFSISGWFHHASTAGADVLLSRIDGVNGVGWKVYMDSSGYMCFGVDASAGSFPSDAACSTSSYADSQWHYLTAVKSGTTSLTLYIDGKQVAQDASITASSISGTNAAIRIGNDADDGTNGWDGFVDEVRYANRALTASEIASEYAARGSVKGIAAQMGQAKQGESLSQGLLGYWKMDAGSGTTISDSSGNGNTSSTFGGSPSWTRGKYGSGLSINASTDTVSVPDNANLDTFGDQMTISLWLNPNQNYQSPMTDQWYHFMNRLGFQFEFGYSGWNEGPSIKVYNTDSTSWESGTSNIPLTAGTWYHFAAVVNKSFIGLYMNGQLISSRNDFSGTLKNGTTLNFAGDSGHNGNFVLDEVRYYNRAFSARDIEMLYADAPGPVGYWKMDEGSGTSAFDASGNQYTGTLTNDVGRDVGKYGGGTSFDGVNDYIDYGNGAGLQMSGSVTVMGWIRPRITNASSYYTVASKWNSSTSTTGFQLTVGNGVAPYPQFGVGISGGYNGTIATTRLENNTWYHVAGVYDRLASKVYIYVNGVLENSYSLASSMGTNTANNFIVGATSESTQWFSGNIDDVRLYNYARTSKQIVEDMNGGHPAGGSPIASQVIHWKMDEQNGSTLNNTNTAQSTLTGTTSGTAWLVSNSCKVNGCLNFDTVTDTVSAGDVSFVDGLTQFTTSFWINPQSLTTYQTMVSKWNGTNQNVFWIGTDNTGYEDEIGVYIASNLTDAGSSFLTSNLNLTIGSWQHITVVYDGTLANSNRIKVYKNGNQVAGIMRGTVAASLVSGSTSNFKIGDSDITNEGLNAYVDEFKFYSSALNQSEVFVDQNNGSSVALGGVLENTNNSNTNTTNDEEYGGAPPVGYWRLDDASGTTAKDVSGNTFSGTLTNMEGDDWITGKYGSGLRFDGVDEYVTIADNASLRMNNGSWTISLWANPANVDQTSPLITKRLNSGTFEQWSMWICGDYSCSTNGQYLAGLFIQQPGTSDRRMVSNVDGADGNWHHYVAVADSAANSIYLYVDGKLQTGSSLSTGSWPTIDNTDPVRIANSNGSGYYSGSVDEVKLYNYARTPAQIAYDYNRGKPLVHLKFDECQGATAYNSALNANGSAAGMDGTIDPGASGNTAVGSCNSGTSTHMWNDGTTGKYNSAIGMDGTDDKITVSYDTKINLTQFTLATWVNFSVLSNISPFIDRYVTFTSPYAFYYYPAISSFVCSINNGSSNYEHVVVQSLNTNTWYHAACTFDGSTMKIYYNGKLILSEAETHTPTSNTNDLLVGYDPSYGNYLNGLLDDVRVYNYPMNASQIITMMNEGSAQRFGPQTGSP